MGRVIGRYGGVESSWERKRAVKRVVGGWKGLSGVGGGHRAI